MIEMTVPSRHMIQNSSPGGLRPSTLLVGHSRVQTRDHRLSKQEASIIAPEPSPCEIMKKYPYFFLFIAPERQKRACIVCV